MSVILPEIGSCARRDQTQEVLITFADLNLPRFFGPRLA
jgi:hypothetical protein